MTTDLTTTKRGFHFGDIRKMFGGNGTSSLRQFGILGSLIVIIALFEILTLLQTGKVGHVPIVLFNKSYWTRLINFDVMIEEGVIDRDDLKLFRFAESAEEIWKTLVAAGLAMHNLRK